MDLKMFNTTTLSLIFNRHYTARQVIYEICKKRPAQFFVATDVPPKDRSIDYELYGETRINFQQIDWDCRLLTYFLDEYPGFKHSLSSAINGFFLNLVRVIIPRDDCVTKQSFFFLTKDSFYCL